MASQVLNLQAVPLYLVLILSAIASLATGLAVPLLLVHRRRKLTVQLPHKNRLLRPAGESLRVRINDLNDEVSITIAAVILCPFLITFPIAFQGVWLLEIPTGRVVPITAVSLFMGALCGYALHRVASRLSNHNLGFLGERLVGEQLGALQALGCRVFHDIPIEGMGNLDHVLVTPGGVFAVETKMRRRQRRVRAGEVAHRVSYDGQRLRYPFGCDEHGLNQSRRNARWLADLLSQATASKVEVTPVLVLPHWEVRRVARGDVTVVSHKELKALARFKPNASTRLSESQFRRICFALQERAMCDGVPR